MIDVITARDGDEKSVFLTLEEVWGNGLLYQSEPLTIESAKNLVVRILDAVVELEQEGEGS